MNSKFLTWDVQTILARFGHKISQPYVWESALRIFGNFVAW